MDTHFPDDESRQTAIQNKDNLCFHLLEKQKEINKKIQQFAVSGGGSKKTKKTNKKKQKKQTKKHHQFRI